MPNSSKTSAPIRRIFSVSELNTETKKLLEQRFLSVYVQGEVSNFSAPRSGHWYFTLKDAEAQIRIVMFKNMNMRVTAPKVGDEVIVNGQLSFYRERGEVQIIARQLRADGLGDLQAQFDTLKAKLAEEGLFDSDRKTKLPPLPKHVAVITSATGSVIQDIIHVTRRRAPTLRISILPVSVQGEAAVESICNALSQCEQQGRFDAVILARGGGSLEDLAAFNSEPVARAIADSHTPIVSAVGHETDVSIADFVADRRAATPSEAAELLTSEHNNLSARVDGYHERLKARMQGLVDKALNNAHILSLKLVDPRSQLREFSQRADGLEARLHVAQKNHLSTYKNRVAVSTQRLDSRLLRNKVSEHQSQLVAHQHQIQTALKQIHRKAVGDFTQQIKLLNTLNPLNTLARGYALVTDENSSVITSITTIEAQTNIQVQVQDGSIDASVVGIKPRKKDGRLTKSNKS